MEFSVTSRASGASDARPDGSRAGSDYAVLSRQVRDAGLLRRRPVRGGVLLIVTAAMPAGGWALHLAVGDSWWQTLRHLYTVGEPLRTGG